MSVGLTKDQLEQFEKDGLLVIDNFLSPEEVTAIREGQRNQMHPSEPCVTVHVQYVHILNEISLLCYVNCELHFS